MDNLKLLQIIATINPDMTFKELQLHYTNKKGATQKATPSYVV